MTADPASEDTSAWDPNVLPRGSANDDLVLLATESMRARRRPLPISVLWGWQTLMAALVALPTAAAVASFYGSHPSGDAPLWQPGGLPLVDLFLDAGGARRETVVLAAMVFVGTGFADLVPIASLLASIAFVTRDRRAPPIGATLARGAAAFPTFATLFAMASLAEGTLALVAVVASARLSESILSKLGDARADQTAWLVALAIFALTGVVGVLHDLARASAVRFRVKALRAWQLGLNAMVRAPASVFWSWVWRGLAGWVPVAMGALVATRYGGRGGGPLVALFIVHQVILAGRVAFRASWLAAAMRAVDAAHRVVGRR